MIFLTDGRIGISKWHRRWLRFTFTARSYLQSKIKVSLGDDNYIYFTAESLNDFFRPTTLFTKEPGTIEWIDKEVKESDIFYDIGANLGIYSIYAAHKIKSGKVYSFEPHAVNFSSLLKNILLNNFMSKISPISCALSDKSDLVEFNYYKMESGTTASQLGASGYDNFHFTPAATELKYCVSIDNLIETKGLPPANHIKIDVDGIELKILKGMKNLLCSSSPPKTIQVEINLTDRIAIDNFMKSVGYYMATKHFTKEGQKRLLKNIDVDKIPFNAIYRKTEA